ncbi:hypothetical protein, partial [Aerococcus tenax]|uniref:hypothetical protein n=4 Tax=Aerococcaceae TaxID=186827 RepID=UPI001E472DD5
AISFLLLQNYTLAIMLLFLIHIIVIKNSIGYINIYKNITEINFKEISLGIFFIIISLILSLLVIRIS